MDSRGIAVTMPKLPNLISAVRLVLGPVLILLASADRHGWFLGILIVAMFTDMVDGYIARKTCSTSETGTVLDSIADLMMYAAMLVGGILLWPALMYRVRYVIAAIVGMYLIAAGAGFLKFHRLTNYHTTLAKMSAILMSGAVLILFLFENPIVFRVMAVLQVIALLENLAVTIVLPGWRHDIPSVFHAVRIARAETRGRGV